MIFKKTKIENAFTIEIEMVKDSRGFFATSWEPTQFEKNGLNPNLVECNISFNKKKGTMRGLHYQIKPFEQSKLIRCTKGRIFDVAIDLKPDSKSFKKWISVELSADNHKMNYIPEGCAHGFQTLEDNTEVFYQMSQVYSPNHTRGIRWNDKSFNVSWPLKSTIISDKDLSWPDFSADL